MLTELVVKILPVYVDSDVRSSFSIKVRLISAIVLPYINYCYLLLIDNTAELDATLQRALNACMTFIFKLRKFTHVIPYLAKLNWLPTRKRRFYFLGSLIYQVKCKQLPPYLFKCFFCSLRTVLQLFFLFGT